MLTEFLKEVAVGSIAEGSISTGGHVALKSASPQVRKFIFVAQQCKLRFSKVQLRSLRFKLLDATLNCNFYDYIRYETMVSWALRA